VLWSLTILEGGQLGTAEGKMNKDMQRKRLRGTYYLETAEGGIYQDTKRKQVGTASFWEVQRQRYAAIW
jgi:hypothetical protein